MLEERQLLDAVSAGPPALTASSSARFIAGLYKDLLHRTPHESEVAGWVSALAAGHSREQVAQLFISSPEYRSNLISENYRKLLGRNAGPQEPMDWLGNSQVGLDERQIRAKFLASKAYTGDQLNDSRSWLAGVYEDILGRPPDLLGANSWQRALSSGASREQVVLGILNSVEANTQTVVTTYRGLLGRDPDASGLRSFVPALAQGLSPSGLNLLLVSSPEYVFKQTQVVPSAVPNYPSGKSDHSHWTGYDYIPDFAAHPTNVSVASGAWSNPGIWSDGRIPTEGDVVIVGEGTSVTYDVVSGVHLKTVDVEAGGHLHFRTDVDTKIIVGNFVVEPDGDLEIGTLANPVDANVMAEVLIADQPIDLRNDPSQYGTGLIGLGKVTIHGAEKTSFVRLAVEPVEGDTALILDEPATGWRVGDALVLPDSRFLDWQSRLWNYSPHWEEVEIQRISPDGRVLTLTRPLAFDHPGARNQVSGALEFLPHAVNRTRNVMIESEASDDDGTRGHTMFTDRADVDIRFAGFCELGRTTVQPIDNTTFDSNTGEVTHIGTNQIGRYPMHIHHLLGPEKMPEDGYQFTLEGNVIDGGGGDEQYDWKWGITVHASHYGLVKDNVVYDVAGAGIVMEDGSESYNVIEHNMVLRVYGTGSRSDQDAVAGSAFWFRGPNNYVRDNLAADAVGGLYTYGFNYFTYYTGWSQVPTHPGVDPAEDGHWLNMNDTPILEFARNEVYGATASGMTYWWIGALDGTRFDDASESVIKDLRVWNTWFTALYQYSSGHVTIDGLVARSGYDSDSRGIEFADYNAYNAVIKNSDIQGFYVGIMMPKYGDETTVEDSYVQANVDIMVSTHFSTNGSWRLPAKTAIIRNVRFGSPPERPLIAIRMNYLSDGAGNLIQLDQVFVYGFDGVVGDNFQVFYWQQAPDYIVPQSTSNIVGSPLPGLTNAESWRRFGIAIGGAIAPNDWRSGIEGWVGAF